MNEDSVIKDYFEINKEGVLIKYLGPASAVTIPDGVTAIGGEAFWCCSGLESIVIPSSVTKIGEGAFYDCSSLREVVSYSPNIVVESGLIISNDILICCVSKEAEMGIPSSVTTIGW